MPAERRGRGGLFRRVTSRACRHDHPNLHGLAGAERGACPSFAHRCRALCRALIVCFKNDGMLELLGGNFW
jgi:hypothetical protein